jgi:hypothetical protein
MLGDAVVLMVALLAALGAIALATSDPGDEHDAYGSAPRLYWQVWGRLVGWKAEVAAFLCAFLLGLLVGYSAVLW